MAEGLLSRLQFRTQIRPAKKIPTINRQAMTKQATEIPIMEAFTCFILEFALSEMLDASSMRCMNFSASPW